MKLVLVILIALLIATSLLADYFWRRWVAQQKARRENIREDFKS